MVRLGCHLSLSQGYGAMAESAVAINADTFQFFTRNPRGSRRKTPDPEDLRRFREIVERNGLGPLVAHAPYTLNPASAKESVREFARVVVKEDLELLETFPTTYYNFHPGSHVGQGVEQGISHITDILNQSIPENCTVPILLETMAGKGTEIGKTFEELRMIIDRIHRQDLIGVLLDTCHVHEGNYPIKDQLDRVLEEFDEKIGLFRLKALHINDSKNPQGAGKDRHEKLGKGEIGWELFRAVVNHPVLSTLPLILETPQEDVKGYEEEIAELRSMVNS